MAILREHRIEKVPISEVCEKHGLQPTVFYGRKKKLFEEGAVVFELPRGASRGTDPSADPGAKPEGPAAAKLVPPIFSIAFGISTNAINPPACGRQVAAPPRASGGKTAFDPGDGLPDRCNSGRLVLHFRLNQDAGTPGK